MKNIFLIFTVLLSFIGYSQEDVLNDPDFVKFKKDYINLFLSDDFNRYMDLKDEFLKKKT